jgi:hypothetical protein
VGPGEPGEPEDPRADREKCRRPRRRRRGRQGRQGARVREGKLKKRDASEKVGALFGIGDRVWSRVREVVRSSPGRRVDTTVEKVKRTQTSASSSRAQ